MSNRGVAWHVAYENTGTINVFSSGVVVDYAIPDNHTIVRVLVNLAAVCIWAPSGGSPIAGCPLLHLTLTDGATTHRESWWPMSTVLSTYVPSGSSNTYWYGQWWSEDHDSTWNAQTRIGGPGVTGRTARLTMACSRLGNIPSGTPVEYALKVAYVVMDPP